MKHFLLFREADVIRQFCMGRDVLVQFKGHLCENFRVHTDSSDCCGDNYIYWIRESALKKNLEMRHIPFLMSLIHLLQSSFDIQMLQMNFVMML